MRLVNTAALVAAMALLIPGLVWAADLDEQVHEMKQRIQQMEGELRTQDRELAAAEENRSVKSALSSFLEKTDFSGFVAAGWNWGKSRNGAGTELNDINTFQLDQAWIEMSKKPTEESRGGFNLAFEMGAYATQGDNLLGSNVPVRALEAFVLGAGNSYTPAIYSAYVSYLVPLGNGLQIDSGIMPTVLGAEVENQNGNWQISRGLVWALQPVTNTGVTASYRVTEALTVMVGAINNPVMGQRRDMNSEKAVTSQIKYAADKFSLAAGLNWGKSDNNAAESPCLMGGGVPVDIENFPAVQGCSSEGIFDVVATIEPMEKFSAWANYDYRWARNLALGTTRDSGLDGHVHAIAVAGRFAVLKSLGVSGRFEYLKWHEQAGQSMWEVTATIDRTLTQNLMAKVEYRHDRLKDGTNAQFSSSNAVLTQLLYSF